MDRPGDEACGRWPRFYAITDKIIPAPTGMPRWIGLAIGRDARRLVAGQKAKPAILALGEIGREPSDRQRPRRGLRVPPIDLQD